MNNLFRTVRAIAVGLTLITTVGMVSSRAYSRYGSDQLTQIPIATDGQDPGHLSGQRINFSPNEQADNPHNSYNITLMFEQDGQPLPIQLQNIDLSLMLPQAPASVQNHAELTQWFLTEREFNRQRVLFAPDSEHLVLLEDIGDYPAENIALAITNNCLGAGYWEIALYHEPQEGGDRQKIYQGYFTFPRRAYGQLVAELNDTSYLPLINQMEGWLGFDFHKGRFFDLAALRQVETETIIAGRDRAQEAVLAQGEQQEKAALIVDAPQPETWQDLKTQTVQFQSFVPPGVYTEAEQWTMDLAEMGKLTGAIARQVRSPLATKLLTEVELTFTSSQGKTRKLIVSGIDLEQLPQLEPTNYSQGLYMPLGFGTPFTQDYDELTQNPPHESPFFTAVLDGENRLLHYRKQVGINGIVLHRDAQNPKILHLYPMSYERITLTGHYTLDLSLMHHTDQAAL